MFDFFKIQKVTSDKKEISKPEDFNNIDAITVYIKNETGIDFENQKTILKSKVTTLCRMHNIRSFQECMHELQHNNSFKQEAINYLTTNESFFYREFHQIESLVKKVQKADKSVKILCAPSANGEEPYSIAIALFEAGINSNKFHITGIDISSKAIKKSQEAIYNKNTTRNLSAKLLTTYFTKKDDLYHLNNEVKNQVNFHCMNIFEKEFTALGKFDYIFSRNMLIYFDYKTRREAHAIFKSHLCDKKEKIFFGHADLADI